MTAAAVQEVVTDAFLEGLWNARVAGRGAVWTQHGGAEGGCFGGRGARGGHLNGSGGVWGRRGGRALIASDRGGSVVGGGPYRWYWFTGKK